MSLAHPSVYSGSIGGGPSSCLSLIFPSAAVASVVDARHNVMCVLPATVRVHLAEALVELGFLELEAEAFQQHLPPSAAPAPLGRAVATPWLICIKNVRQSRDPASASVCDHLADATGCGLLALALCLRVGAEREKARGKRA